MNSDEVIDLVSDSETESEPDEAMAPPDDSETESEPDEAAASAAAAAVSRTGATRSEIPKEAKEAYKMLGKQLTKRNDWGDDVSPSRRLKLEKAFNKAQRRRKSGSGNSYYTYLQKKKTEERKAEMLRQKQERMRKRAERIRHKREILRGSAEAVEQTTKLRF